ncbi:MAG: phosphate ABC transporter permease PstA [Planctomycetia bacterium]|nr:phosphate ABC transporter permease PstA [Planctomycetia bacterium]
MKRRGLILRKVQQKIFDAACLAAVTLSVALMFWIIATLFRHGFAVINWELLTEPSKPYGIPHQGIANALLGTVLITSVATLLAVPLGLAGGIYLAEYDRHSTLADLVRLSANVLMGIPSIVIGLFVYAVWVVPTGHFSGWAGSIALAIIMVPIILRTTEDMLLLVPDTMRESALALGISRWRTTLSVVCRSCRSGLVTGVLLAFARICGETAPLLFTALWSHSWPSAFFSTPVANMPVLITEYMTASPFEEQQKIGWAAATVMLAIILILNITLRTVFHRKRAL